MAQYQGVFPIPQAPTGAVRSESDFPNLTTAERETGLTTAESQQNLDTSTAEVKKTSFMTKIKDKTLKLKTKVKKELHSRTSDKDTTTDTAAGQIDESNISSSDDESENTPGSEVPYEQLPKRQGESAGVADRAYSNTSTPSVQTFEDAKPPSVQSGDAYDKTVSGLENSSTENIFTAGREQETKADAEAIAEPRGVNDGSPDFISPYRAPGPVDTLQAVPTQYFYKESRAAPLTEEDSRHSLSDVSPAADHISTEDAPVLAGWGEKDEVSSATSRDYPSGGIDDSISQGPFPTDQQEFKGSAAAEKDDLPFAERIKEAALAAGSAETAKHQLGDEVDLPDTEKTADDLTNVTDKVAGAGLGTFPSEQEYDRYEEKSVTEHAEKNLKSPEDNVAGATYGAAGEDTPSEQELFTHEATDGQYHTKETILGAAGTTDSSEYGEEQKPVTEQGEENLYSAKENVVETGLSPKDIVGENEDSSTYEEQQQPLTERAKEGLYLAKDKAVDIIPGFAKPQSGAEKSYTEQLTEGIYGVKDKVIGYASGESKSEYAPKAEEVTSEQPDQTVDAVQDAVVKSASEADNVTAQARDIGYSDDQKPYTERATETLGIAKDWVIGTAYSTKDVVAEAMKTGTENTQGEGDSISANDPGKPWTEKTKNTLSGLAGTVGSKLGYGSDTQSSNILTGSANEDSSSAAEKKPWSQQVQESAFSAKDVIASKLGYSSSQLAEEKTFNESVDEGIDEVKDSATVTKEAAAARFQPDEHDKALSEKITSTLGSLSLGGSSPKTTTGGDTKSIFGRVSDGVSSLLWKKPVDNNPEQDVSSNEVPQLAQQVGEDTNITEHVEENVATELGQN
eukprot:TRINITY_DN49_c0_g1_i1.p1 TRINITY_DN49_c0_g1~~TRINITY_DN49_c0_g1_i1.p1  ORF type:complete len:852 (+),score=222.13 TRINITY_DN49_c0_g1_i1:147-2702(+)